MLLVSHKTGFMQPKRKWFFGPQQSRNRSCFPLFLHVKGLELEKVYGNSFGSSKKAVGSHCLPRAAGRTLEKLQYASSLTEISGHGFSQGF